MQKITLILACLAYAGHGRRVQTANEHGARDWELENIARYRAGEISDVELGMANLKNAMQDPSALSEVMGMLRNPDDVAEVEKVMDDKNFQRQVKGLLSKLNAAAALNPSIAGAGNPSKVGSQPPSVARRDLLAKVLSASALLGAGAANAEIDYSGVGYLGGAKNIDVNNANVRVYQKLPGMYPIISGKIISNAPYKNKEEMYTKAKLDSSEIDTVKKYDSTFLFLEPKPEYIIDNINNGLYRR